MKDHDKCKNCIFLRSDISVISKSQTLSKVYGKIVWPCNRYPMNIFRAKDEPACGEFKAE